MEEKGGGSSPRLISLPDDGEGGGGGDDGWWGRWWAGKGVEGEEEPATATLRFALLFYLSKNGMPHSSLEKAHSAMMMMMSINNDDEMQ